MGTTVQNKRQTAAVCKWRNKKRGMFVGLRRSLAGNWKRILIVQELR